MKTLGMWKSLASIMIAGQLSAHLPPTLYPPREKGLSLANSGDPVGSISMVYQESRKGNGKR